MHRAWAGGREGAGGVGRKGRVQLAQGRLEDILFWLLLSEARPSGECEQAERC